MLEQLKEIKVDYILFTGDFCCGRSLPINANETDFVKQCELLIKILGENSEQKMGFVLGNHDPEILANRLSSYPHISNVHCKKIEMGNYILGGIGGSHLVTPQLMDKTVPFYEGTLPDIYLEDPKFEYIREVKYPYAPYLYINVYIAYKKCLPTDILLTHTPPLLPKQENLKRCQEDYIN